MSEAENRYAFTLQEQLRADLSRKIEDGIYKPGDRLPSESELVEAYGVSRVTVRAALGMLVDEGVLVKRRGKGTFVRPTTIVESALTSGSWSISSTCGSARSRSVRDGFAMETPFSNTGAGMRGRRGRSPKYTSVARADAPTAGYRFGDATSRTTRWGNCRGKRFCFSLRPRVAVPYRAASQGTREEAATRQGRNQMRS